MFFFFSTKQSSPPARRTGPRPCQGPVLGGRSGVCPPPSAPPHLGPQRRPDQVVLCALRSPVARRCAAGPPGSRRVGGDRQERPPPPHGSPCEGPRPKAEGPRPSGGPSTGTGHLTACRGRAPSRWNMWHRAAQAESSGLTFLENCDSLSALSLSPVVFRWPARRLALGSSGSPRWARRGAGVAGGCFPGACSCFLPCFGCSQMRGCG
jgi:hypothetical protein